MMAEERPTNMVNVITHAKTWPYSVSHYSEYALSSAIDLSIYSNFIAIVFRGYNAAFLWHCFLCDGTVDMQI